MFDYIKSTIIPEKNDIIHKIFKTTFIKKTLNSFLIIFLAFVLSSILYSVLSIIIIFNDQKIDFVIQCIISIMLCTWNKYIHKSIDFFEPQIYKFTKYVINNYSYDNYVKWKNLTVFVLIFICYVYSCLIEISSGLIKSYLLQYAICYIYLNMNEFDVGTIKSTILKIHKKFDKNTYYISDKSIYGDCVLINKKTLPPSISEEFIIIDNHIEPINTTIDSIPNGVAKSTVNNVAKSTAKSTVNNVAKSTANSTAKSTANSTAKSTVNNVAKSTANSVAKSTANNVTKSTVNSVAKSTSNSVTNSVAKSTANNSVNSVVNNDSFNKIHKMIKTNSGFNIVEITNE